MGACTNPQGEFCTLLEQALAAAEGGGDGGREEAQALMAEADMEMEAVLAGLPPELQARYGLAPPPSPAGTAGGAGPRRDHGVKRSPGPASPTRAAKRHRVGSAGTVGDPSEDGAPGASRGTEVPGNAEGPSSADAAQGGGSGDAPNGAGIEERPAEDGDVDYAGGDEEEEDDEGTLDEEEALAAGEGTNLKVCEFPLSYLFVRRSCPAPNVHWTELFHVS